MSSGGNYPPLRPPPRPRTPSGHRSQSSLSQTSVRSESSLSTTSTESSQPLPPTAPPTVTRRSPYIPHQGIPERPSTSGGLTPAQSSSNLSLLNRQYRTSIDGPMRTTSPNMPAAQSAHRARQHSQGFFEPSLPHASSNSSGLSASQIAAQAAMHHISSAPGQERKRSHPGLAPINTASVEVSRRPSGMNSPQMNSAGGLPYSNGTLGGNRLAAATAANVAFPNGRSPLPSPNPLGGPPPPVPPIPQPAAASLEKEGKSKASKMKLFSKPKNINLSKEKEGKNVPTLPSPGKGGLLRSGFAPNASSTSLVNPDSNSSSLYSSANLSTSTLVPTTTADKDKEKRHLFSRPKHKAKDEPGSLPLSSAHSNSQATNPDKPQPLYSFTPDSPGPNSFAKSMSGFDLRHGGRALREKKKEEKAAAAAQAQAKLDLAPVVSNGSAGQHDHFLGPPYDNVMGPPSGSASIFSFPSDSGPLSSQQAFSSIGAQMGLPGLGPDDAWPLLKARLLNLFSGEDLRTPIEDFNMLVNVHIRRCIQRKSPIMLIEDLRELLQTGFTSLSQTVKGVPDDRLVAKLVEMWIGVYGSIMPFLQAVFLPLDLEFKGRGSVLTIREAQEFWGAMPESLKFDERPTSAGGTARMPILSEELDVRRITLISFRDTVILPRQEILMITFSRLSLDSINAAASPEPGADGGSRKHARSDPAVTGAERPDTAGSLSPRLGSFNSQASTLLEAGSNSSASGLPSARSRATSNTSAGSFGTSMPHLNSPLSNVTSNSGPGSFNPRTSATSPPPTLTDPTKITDTVARMLQCLYVLASCQTGDVGQGVVERLTGALKYNWLGRGRTGRDRRGFVGMKSAGGSHQRIGLVGA